MSLLLKEINSERLTLTLHRPELHNALNDRLIDELDRAFTEADANDAVRYVVLAGAGKSFCAGADLQWMQKVYGDPLLDKQESERLVRLLERMIFSSKPILARVHGAALGGGMGLIAACDLVVAAPHASFGLTEVRLGLAPSMIFPFLQRKVSRSRLLQAALLGDRFDGATALQMGLINAVVDDIDAQLEAWGKSLIAGGPMGQSAVKQLFHHAAYRPWHEMQAMTLSTISELRRSAEGQEGMNAFLEKRVPSWAAMETRS